METVCRNWVKIHPAIFGGTETSVWTQWLNKAQDKCLNETTLLTGVADALHSTFNLSASVRPNSDLPPPPFYSKNCENLFAENERKAFTPLSSAKAYYPTRVIIDHIGIFGRSVSDYFFLIANRFYSGCPGGSLTWLKMNSRGPKDLIKIPILVILIRASQRDMKSVCRAWVKRVPDVFGGTSTTAQNKCMNETALLHRVVTGVTDSLHSTFNLSASVRPCNDLPPPPFYSKKCEGLFAGNGRKAALIPLFP
eukprot:CAMPEP_0171784696 /NCGR_PEP_ID=MMETSP0991-20121206/62235_1 /TAXON_ID=483369 /ORGANISM="non described non described, Strain CCMP2098" /LENGTH=251 /DNA_ID=CAMNT_0012393059 /DNA_START=66 /DNA_END=820 /DNA_ORIENTATION=-